MNGLRPPLKDSETKESVVLIVSMTLKIVSKIKKSINKKIRCHRKKKVAKSQKRKITLAQSKKIAGLKLNQMRKALMIVIMTLLVLVEIVLRVSKHMMHSHAKKEETKPTLLKNTKRPSYFTLKLSH